MRVRVLAAMLLVSCCATNFAAAADRVTFTLPAKQAALLGRGPVSGRIVLFLKSTRCRERGDPADGPFFSDPQPIYSRSIAGLQPDVAVELGADASMWPGPLDGLTGTFMAQAVLKRSRDEGGVLAPGNLITEPVEVTLDPATDQHIKLEFTAAIPPLEMPASAGLVTIDEPSPMLTRATGRAVRHRAAVVLPPGYHDVTHARRIWPTIYVIPGFGGRMTAALETQRLLGLPQGPTAIPQAVYVVLDPEGPFGHHGFADSVINGPRGAALVQELIPMLEDRFRLVKRPEARLLTGHSSGGWSSLWLQLTNPDFFGGCWSSSPDPVDFSAFQVSDLYTDANLYTDKDGEERGSFRRTVGPMEKVLMTAREEMGMERAIDPNGGSGQQWDAWFAMFSPPDARTGMPRRLADPETGAIDHALVNESWSGYDIARLIERRWGKLAPVLNDKVHLVVGSADSFYLERAVKRLKAKIDVLRREICLLVPLPEGSGFIEVLPDATHDTAAMIARGRFSLDMKRHLQKAGLAD